MFEGRSSSLVRAAASGWSGLWVMAALVIPGLLAPRPFAPRPFVPRPLAQEPPVTKRVECREWHDCRQLALDAFAQGDYERFHDLAWRTVQIGPPRNAELMYLLARAQSLSGRAHDALVMLGRLVEMAVTTDAATNDEFRVVRTLREWPALEARMLALGTPPVSLSAAQSGISTPGSPTPGSTPPPAPAASGSSESRAAAVPPRVSGVPPQSAVVPPRASVSSPFAPEDVVRLPSTSLNPTGLAYDRVSGRFVLADRRERKLLILDERSQHLVDLVGAQSAGFYEITALEIDLRRGDLWVVSANAPGTDKEPTAVLHKLQLVSGRPLAALPLPEQFGAARFEDVAVDAEGTVFVLDSIGGRIFRHPPDEHSFAVAGTIGLDHPTSIAPVDDHCVYVADAKGLARIDVSTSAVTRLTSPKDIQLTGIERIRWHRGSLVGVQRLANGTRRVVSIRLAKTGRRALALTVVESGVAMSDSTAATLSEDVFYFVTREPQGQGDSDLVVRRTRLPF